MAEVADWRDMSSAPKDGTMIEIKRTRRGKPMCGLHVWLTERPYTNQATGEVSYDKLDPVWANVGIKDGIYYVEHEEHLQWRPYNGTAENYIDPTNGAQFTGDYWRYRSPPIQGTKVGQSDMTFFWFAVSCMYGVPGIFIAEFLHMLALRGGFDTTNPSSLFNWLTSVVLSGSYVAMPIYFLLFDPRRKVKP